MPKQLNFNNIKKRYLTVTLPDEKRTTLLVGTPKRSTLKKFKSISIVEEDSEDDFSDEELDEIYEVTTEILNCNKAGKKFTVDEIGDVLDFEDLFVFFSAYGEFVESIANSKN